MKQKDILADIVANKRKELALQKQSVSPLQMHRLAQSALQGRQGVVRSMRQTLAASSSGIIAEFKRRSPSKGWIHADARVADVVPAYEAAGASAVSVLTDGDFFGGSLDDLREARSRVRVPLLRKDFIVDEYQLEQACVAGADAVLLIAACLTCDECVRLTRRAHALSLEVLLEVHAPDELAYVTDEVDMLGVNNRHLGTFHTDVQTSFDMADRLLKEHRAEALPLLVSESGISDPSVVRRLRAVGYRGFLVGEALMKNGLPAEALKEVIAKL